MDTISLVGSSGSHVMETRTTDCVPSDVQSPPGASGTNCTNAPPVSSLSSPTSPIVTSTFTTVKLVVQVADAVEPHSFVIVAATVSPSARYDALATSAFVAQYAADARSVRPVNEQMPHSVHEYEAGNKGAGLMEADAVLATTFDRPASVRSSPR